MAWQGGTECLFYIPVNCINVPLTFSVRETARLRQKEFHFQEEYENKLACRYIRNADKKLPGTLGRFISAIKPLSTELENIK